MLLLGDRHGRVNPPMQVRLIGLFLLIFFGGLALLKMNSLFYLGKAIHYSQIFLNIEGPFVDIKTLHGKREVTLDAINVAIKKGYLKNCTIEINNGVPKVVLARGCPKIGTQKAENPAQ